MTCTHTLRYVDLTTKTVAHDTVFHERTYEQEVPERSSIPAIVDNQLGVFFSYGDGIPYTTDCVIVGGVALHKSAILLEHLVSLIPKHAQETFRCRHDRVIRLPRVGKTEGIAEARVRRLGSTGGRGLSDG